MFKSILQKVREVLYKMGLIRGLKQIQSHKDVIASDEHYNLIDKWKQLYKGYYADIHDYEVKTINGVRNERRLSLHMPKVLSQELAQLIFNEKCNINISNEKISDFINDILKQNKFTKRFQTHLEYMFSSGGMVAKPYVIDGEIKISFVEAESFIPVSTRNGEVWEGVFVNETQKGDTYYTLLEWHTFEEGYAEVRESAMVLQITNELYKSKNKGELGVKTDLAELYPYLEDVVRLNDIKRPIFTYFKPNIANNFETNSPLGISVYANAIDTLKLIDTAFDSFYREFKLGKKRIIVPESAIKTVINQETGEMVRYFDADDEVYQAMKFGDNLDANNIKDTSVELRVEEHISAINGLLDILSLQTGFSAGTFTFDGQGVKTATEVVSENSKTYRTKNSHETVIEEGLIELIENILDIASLYKIFTETDNDLEITIDFDDSIAQDRDSNADYYLKLKNGGILSATTTLISILDYTEEQAKEELERIREERATLTPDIDDMFRGGGE